MRACIIAVAVIALTQPAIAAKSHKKKSHRHHVSHLSPRTSAVERPVFRNPFFQNWSWQQTSTLPAAPAAPQAAPFGEPAPRKRNARVHNGALDGMIARHAAANGLPVDLVHRVVKRESGYNPRARSGSNLGLMQIKYATARGVGYTGPASGLMDPETNLTYATRYLAGAYRAAGGSANRAVALYASGYHGRGVPRATRMTAEPWQTQTAPGEW